MHCDKGNQKKWLMCAFRVCLTIPHHNINKLGASIFDAYKPFSQ